MTMEEWQEITTADLSAQSELPPLVDDPFSDLALTTTQRNIPPDPDPVPDPLQCPAPLGDAAYHGLAGEIVRLLEPHTESDPAALLFTFLTMFGNAVGSGAHLTVEAERHPARLYTVIVGDTSKARKGTSKSQILRFFRASRIEVPRPWLRSGLVSGEGIIWHVRDPVQTHNRKGELVTEPGVEDKRLMIAESEFAAVLQVCNRRGQTLSPVLRGAWDSGDLETLSKQCPAFSTAAHICLLGHITQTELHRHLDNVELANGLVNRVLLVCAKRSKLLPMGGSPPEKLWIALAEVLRKAWEAARGIERMELAPQAEALWRSVYEALSAPGEGLYGAATARGEAQALRLAIHYALLDGRRLILEEHLRAALECWRYARDSARAIFGDATGDPIADRILGMLRKRDDGMTRTEIYRGLSCNVRRDRIDVALDVLREARLARMHVASGGEGEPPLARWWAT